MAEEIFFFKTESKKLVVMPDSKWGRRKRVPITRDGIPNVKGETLEYYNSSDEIPPAEMQ